MGYRSNIGEVAGAMNGLMQAFNLRRRMAGGSGRVGDELADAVALTIEERTRAKQLDPDGRPLARLRPATLRRKARLGYPATIGVETAAMLDVAQVRGKVDVGPETLLMQYGADGEAQRKAEWFQDPTRPSQAPRPFYELGADGEDVADSLLEDVAEDARKEFEGG